MARRLYAPDHSSLAVALGVLAGALAVAWAAWAAFSVDRPPTWTDIGFDLVDDSTTRVTFDTRFAADAPAGTTAVCTLRALNRSFAEVGRLDVRVRRGERPVVRTTATLRTSERAVTGTVKECALGP